MPACYAVFDVLAINGRDVRGKPYRERRALLEDLLSRQLPNGLLLVPVTNDFAVARSWILNHTSAGVEGVVAKRLDETYRSNGRTWSKIRTRLTAEAIVGGVLGPLDMPEALIVGRRDRHGRLHVAGRASLLTPTARHELAALLTPALDDHPWPAAIPVSPFGQLPGEYLEYQKVTPSIVVELDVDTAFEHHRWRHAARFVRVRADLTLEDLGSVARLDH